MPAVQRGGVADAAYHLALGAACQRCQRFVTRVPLHTGDAYFDELVIAQRPRRLSNHSVARACLANEDNGLQGVPQAAKMSALFLGELHHDIVPTANAVAADLARSCDAAGSALAATIACEYGTLQARIVLESTVPASLQILELQVQ